MTRLTTVNIRDGVPYYADLPQDYEECCSCGHVHKVRYRIEDSEGKPIRGAKLRITVWTMEQHTRAARQNIKVHFSRK